MWLVERNKNKGTRGKNERKGEDKIRANIHQRSTTC